MRCLSFSQQSAVRAIAVLCALLFSPIPLVSAGLIDEAPAPPPSKGPPLSAGATRDLSLLPAQLCGIAGSYVLTVLLIGIALLFVGRRFRRGAQTSSRSLDLEMVKPVIPKSIDTTPISPGSRKGTFWPSPIQTKATPPPPWSPSKSPPNFSYPSPTKERFVSFDERVIEEDKAQRERDMERLYEAVMEQDAANASKKSSPVQSFASETGLSSPRKASWGGGRAGAPPPSFPPPKAQIGPSLPANPRSPTDTITSRTSSIASRRRGNEARSIRGMQISSPVPTPTHSLHSRVASDEIPLSPMLPPPAPPIQHDRREAAHAPPPPAPPMSAIGFRPPTSHSGTSTPRHPPNPLPLRSHPSSDAGSGPLSPGSTTTKLTVLERKAPGHHHAGLNPGTAALRTPGTGIPVPYSPYMPFTPVTPIMTPRLVTRQERKRRQKEEGREIVSEMVEDDTGMWDGGY